MLKRQNAFWNRLKRPGWERIGQAFLISVRPGLRASSRMLVSALLGIVGVGAAASIALFAGGTDGGGERYVPSTALSEPLAAQERVRSGWLTLALDSSMPERYFNQLLSLVVELEAIEAEGVRKTVYLLDQPPNADVQIGLAPGAEQAEGVLYTRYMAPVAPFATVEDDVSIAELRLRWQGRGGGPLIVEADYVSELEVVFGEEADPSVHFASSSSLPALLEATDGAIAIVPFENLTPVLKVLHLNGVNILSNSFSATAYPLTVVVAVTGSESETIAEAIRPHISQSTNRNSDQLSTLIMTGVTAMARVTAARMDSNGFDYPAWVIAPTLRAADITHVSNEVPFLEDCVADPSLNNMILCSDTEYWATLEAIGTDIVGLSGNHINDFGRDGARESIGWYRQNGIQIYGAGLNERGGLHAAVAGSTTSNSFAFIAALAHHPTFAWATADEPGACYYFDNKEKIFAYDSNCCAARST